MSRVNTPQLTDKDRPVLARGFKYGDSHCFRDRCHVILLKAEGRTSKPDNGDEPYVGDLESLRLGDEVTEIAH
jgi:hypothetical protein